MAGSISQLLATIVPLRTKFVIDAINGLVNVSDGVGARIGDAYLSRHFWTGGVYAASVFQDQKVPGKRYRSYSRHFDGSYGSYGSNSAVDLSSASTFTHNCYSTGSRASSVASRGRTNTVIAPAATSMEALAVDISPASTATPVTATMSGRPVVA